MDIRCTNCNSNDFKPLEESDTWRCLHCGQEIKIIKVVKYEGSKDPLSGHANARPFPES